MAEEIFNPPKYIFKIAFAFPGWEPLPYLAESGLSLEKKSTKKRSLQDKQIDMLAKYQDLSNLIQSTFAHITKKGIVMKGIY